MYTLETVLYSISRYLPCIRKILYRKAAKTDSVLAKIMLLLEFENVHLVVEEVEEFRDLKLEQYPNLPTEIVARSKIPNNYPFEEEHLFSVMDLSKSHFQTRAEKSNNQINTSFESPTNESQLNFEELQLVLKDTHPQLSSSFEELELMNESQLNFEELQPVLKDTHSQLSSSFEELQLVLKDTHPQLSSSSEEPESIEMEFHFANFSKGSVPAKTPLTHLPLNEQSLEDIKKNNDLTLCLSSMDIIIIIVNLIMIVGIFQMLEGILDNVIVILLLVVINIHLHFTAYQIEI